MGKLHALHRHFYSVKRWIVAVDVAEYKNIHGVLYALVGRYFRAVTDIIVAVYLFTAVETSYNYA